MRLAFAVHFVVELEITKTEPHLYEYNSYDSSIFIGRSEIVRVYRPPQYNHSRPLQLVHVIRCLSRCFSNFLFIHAAHTRTPIQPHKETTTQTFNVLHIASLFIYSSIYINIYIIIIVVVVGVYTHTHIYTYVCFFPSRIFRSFLEARFVIAIDTRHITLLHRDQAARVHVLSLCYNNIYINIYIYIIYGS